MTEAQWWGRQAASGEFCPSGWLGCDRRVPHGGFWVSRTCDSSLRRLGSLCGWQGKGVSRGGDKATPLAAPRGSGEQGERWEGHLGNGPLSPGSSTHSGISGEWLDL